MPFWTLFGLQQGKATTQWPKRPEEAGQAGVFGMPRFTPERCLPESEECAAACPTAAITVVRGEAGSERLAIDYGRCVVCQLCVDACPADAATASFDWAFGVRERSDLMLNGAAREDARRDSASRAGFGRSLHVRHVDAGSCNGCESELQALYNPFYNLHRFGVFFTPSPRFADLLLVTGPVTYAMREPLRRNGVSPDANRSDQVVSRRLSDGPR